MKWTLFGALSAFVWLTGAAVAQENGLVQGQEDYVDTDHNGAVKRGELDVFIGQAFVQLDANKDGVLVVTEVEKILTPEQFAAVDHNGDGKVSKTELLNQAHADFAAADHDHDGTLK
jgi:hypothetical protein